MGQPQDCGVVSFAGETLLATTDLGPWIGVDLFVAGRIAALHAMSDVYACGGVPKFGLVTLMVRADDPHEYAASVMAGIIDAAREEELHICGGHTLVGEEAMAGLAVIGSCSAGPPLRKIGARVGDYLLLSKSLGVGIVVRAHKLGLADETALGLACDVMNRSNGPAAREARQCGAVASTDVSGFGLLGHVAEMLAPGQGVALTLGSVPVLEEARRLAAEMRDTYWTRGNLDYVQSRRPLHSELDESALMPLLDPQTNGGLLIAADTRASTLLSDRGFVPIGRVTGEETITIG